MNSPTLGSILTLLRNVATGASRSPTAEALRRPAETSAATKQRERDISLVYRIHRLRTIGFGVGFVAGASVLQLHHAATAWWVLLLANGFVWPHVALLLALHSADARRAEIRNLTLDSVLGGMWIAVMQFNLLPSVLMVTLMSADKISVGGTRMLTRSLMVMAAMCAATSAILGFPVSVATPMSVILACLPIMIVYPIAISGAAYSLARKVAQQNRRLEELGRIDILTGLANRRHCFAEAVAELARYRRTRRPASLMILDVDQFKTINDRYGHPVGDEVLCGLARVLRACCRAIDTPARHGGDEFMLVLPETDLHGAAELAERIRAQLSSFRIERAPDLRCTVSLGAAEAGPDVHDLDTWIQRADAAMYRAKAGGRDRFEA
jgi:diguanylate cyclase